MDVSDIYTTHLKLEQPYFKGSPASCGDHTGQRRRKQMWVPRHRGTGPCIKKGSEDTPWLQIGRVSGCFPPPISPFLPSHSWQTGVSSPERPLHTSASAHAPTPSPLPLLPSPPGAAHLGIHLASPPAWWMLPSLSLNFLIPPPPCSNRRFLSFPQRRHPEAGKGARGLETHFDWWRATPLLSRPLCARVPPPRWIPQADWPALW